MTNLVAVEPSADSQNAIPVSELTLDVLALVGGGEGAVVPVLDQHAPNSTL